MHRTGERLIATACFAARVGLLLATGCRGPWSKDWKFSDMCDVDVTPWSHDEDAVGDAARMVGTWTDTVLHQSGKKPQRGFGGRLIFYGKEAEKPVLVDGQLVIYAFDETNREPTDNKPTRRYVFPPDQMSRRMSKTELGPSYSFWLPWDEVGGPQTEISLIARFEPKDGADRGWRTDAALACRARRAATGIVNNAPPKLAGWHSDAAGDAAVGLARRASAGAVTAANQVQLASYETRDRITASTAAAARAADDDDVDFAAGEFPRARRRVAGDDRRPTIWFRPATCSPSRNRRRRITARWPRRSAFRR